MSNIEQTLSIIKPDAVERNFRKMKLKRFLRTIDLIFLKKKKYR